MQGLWDLIKSAFVRSKRRVRRPPPSGLYHSLFPPVASSRRTIYTIRIMPSSKSNKKSSKAQRRVQRGQCRLAPESLGVNAILDDINNGKLNEDGVPIDSLQKAVLQRELDANIAPIDTLEGAILQRKVNENIEKWETQYIHPLFEHHSKANYSPEECRTVVRLATELFADMDEFCDEVHCAYKAAGPIPEKQENSVAWYGKLNALRFRSSARMKLSDFAGSVNDATERLSLIRLGVGSRSCRQIEEGFPPCKDEISVLVTRGVSLRFLEDSHGSCQDLRAAVTGLYAQTEAWVGWPSLQDSLKHLLPVMALRKKPQSRPHYSEAKTASFQKELGLRMFAKENLKCDGCGKIQSQTHVLRLCSLCKNTWFCGKECQKKAW